MELTDRIIPVRRFTRRGPGGRPEVTDAELACIAVAQVLPRCDNERHWLRIAPRLIRHLFTRLLAQSEYNTRLRQLAPLMEAALRWLADATPAAAEMLRLMDATPVPCGQSAVSARRSDLYGYAGYGYCSSHSRWYWGCKLLLICTCDGTVTGFSLANPKCTASGTRPARRWIASQRTGPRPAPRSSRTRACPGQEIEEFFAGRDLGLTLIRPPARTRSSPGRSRTGSASGLRPSSGR